MLRQLTIPRWRFFMTAYFWVVVAHGTPAWIRTEIAEAVQRCAQALLSSGAIKQVQRPPESGTSAVQQTQKLAPRTGRSESDINADDEKAARDETQSASGAAAKLWPLSLLAGFMLGLAYTVARSLRSKSDSSDQYPNERRREPRHRTRLRTGRLFTQSGQYICSCEILDRSVHGARISSRDRFPAGAPLQFYDSVEKRYFLATVAWCKGESHGMALSHRSAYKHYLQVEDAAVEEQPTLEAQLPAESQNL